MSLDIVAVLNTYPDPCPEPALSLVASAAAHLGASVTGLAIGVDIPDVGNALSEALLNVEDLIRGAERRSRDACAALLDRLGRETAAAAVPFAARTIAAAPAGMSEAAVGFARYHDLIAVPLRTDGGADRDVAETLVFEAGRPVLLLPEVTQAAPAWTTIAVATDFGRASLRALHDARPFLERATKILVFTAPDEKAVDTGERAALMAAFVRLGIAAEFETIDSLGRSIGEALQDHALARGAGLLVMGAFGHSRWREFVLGGATASVLAEPRLPVLMSH